MPSPSQTQEDLARLLLRLVLGGLLLLHGVGKLMGGVAGISATLVKAGLPAALAYGVYIGEVVAPLLLIIGLWTRLSAGVVVINMLFAVALVHAHQLATLSPTGGWALELQAFYVAMALAIALLGAGRYSLGGAHGRFN